MVQAILVEWQGSAEMLIGWCNQFQSLTPTAHLQVAQRETAVLIESVLADAETYWLGDAERVSGSTKAAGIED